MPARKKTAKSSAPIKTSSEVLGPEEEEERVVTARPKRTEEQLEKAFEALEFKVVQDRNDFLPYQVIDFVRTNRWINLTPEYQRRKRWDNAKKSKLIESLLMNLPIPPVFLFEVEPARYEVMDGQQRLNAIVELYDHSLTLSGLAVWPELNGLTLAQWAPRMRRGLERRKISAVILRADPTLGEVIDTKEIRREVFERLNTGGEKLNAQELRNCVNSGSMNQLVLDLSRLETFTRVWDIPSYEENEEGLPEPLEPRKTNTLYKTMGDCQIVLRFFAFRDKARIKGSVRSILDRYMEDNQDLDQNEVNTLRQVFTSRLELTVDLFGDDAFRLPSKHGRKLSLPLFDAIMIAIDRAWDRRKALLGKRMLLRQKLMKLLLAEKTYEIVIGKPNTAKAIAERIDVVSAVLK
jgi:hypothetical protein